MRKLLFILFLICFILNIHGQSIKMDSSFSTKKDTIIQKLSKKDSLKKYYKIIPRVSTIRSAMVPGWGQINNRQYWKLPIVAGAFGVNIFFIVYNDTRYHYYRNYLAQTYQTEGNPFPITSVNVPIYQDANNTTRDYDQAQLNNIVSSYRRNRDGSYLLLAVTWAANIIDANVTAHLKTFDVTDDISLKIQPTFSSPEITQQPIFGAKLTLAFK
ncbi:MAG: DUF5683 domain-containing protein [Arcicella sp.]|nr:DUF5683 domain-containing protein [Arcicella sp.]